MGISLLRLTIIIFSLHRRAIIVGALGLAITCAYLIFTIFPRFVASMSVTFLGSQVADDGDLTLACFSLDMACYFFLLSAVISHSDLRRAVIHSFVLFAAWTIIGGAAAYLGITEPFPGKIPVLLNMTLGSTLAIGIYTLGLLLRWGYAIDTEKVGAGVSNGD